MFKFYRKIRYWLVLCFSGVFLGFMLVWVAPYLFKVVGETFEGSLILTVLVLGVLSFMMTIGGFVEWAANA